MAGALDEFIEKYLSELREDNAAVFVGAGFSKAAGFVDWKGLLEPLAHPLGLDVAKETDLVSLAQFHVNSNSGNRNTLSQLLIDKFHDVPEPTENHKVLARLPIRTYWTTNYDRLLELGLTNSGKKVDVKYDVNQFTTTVRGRDAIVYKMHGDVEHPNNAVLTKDDYERYASTHATFITALTGDLTEKTFLFLGFSFTDPNLDYILSRIRTRLEKNQRQHFCITKARSKLADESEEEFAYAKIRQELVIHDLMRFNVKTILVDDYSDITALLNILFNSFRKRTVFVSGSAHDYGEWGRPKTEEFVTTLAAALISKDCRIASGFGLGIGGSVVTGAAQQIYSTNDRSIESHLMLRPFPIGISDDKERMRVFGLYRDELISQAGIAIFIMGNKLVEGAVVKADGVRKEFDLARENGLFCLPIGASGWISADLWAEVKADFEAMFPSANVELEDMFNRLGEKTDDPMTLIEPLLKIIEILRKD